MKTEISFLSLKIFEIKSHGLGHLSEGTAKSCNNPMGNFAQLLQCDFTVLPADCTAVHVLVLRAAGVLSGLYSTRDMPSLLRLSQKVCSRSVQSLVQQVHCILDWTMHSHLWTASHAVPR